MFHSNENPETSVWISTTDLMSGLLVIFLFIALLMTEQNKAAQAKIQEITGQANQAAADIRNQIDKNFTAYDRERFSLNQDGIAFASFQDGSGTFREGSAELTPRFKRELDYFLPRYLKAISDSNQDYIKEIHIEGHASSEWDTVPPVTPEEAFAKNMELSQRRTLSILLYALQKPELAPYRTLIQKKMHAIGYSSSNLKRYPNGLENREASRRIEFRVIANDTATINKIKGAMGQ